MSQRQINVTTNPAALLEKSITLSFHALTTARCLAQGWFSMLFFQSFPFTPAQCPAMLVGPQYSHCGWDVPGPAPPCLPGAQADTAGAFLTHQDAPAQPLSMAGSNTIPGYRNASSNATQQLLTQTSRRLSQFLFVTTEIEPNLLVNGEVWEASYET